MTEIVRATASKPLHVLEEIVAKGSFCLPPSPDPPDFRARALIVSEHVVMMILGLVTNYIPSYHWVVKGGWHIAECVTRSYDVEGMHVGTVAAGRIGLAALRRLKPFSFPTSCSPRS